MSAQEPGALSMKALGKYDDSRNLLQEQRREEFNKYMEEVLGMCMPL
jgi:hypothetical protein